VLIAKIHILGFSRIKVLWVGWICGKKTPSMITIGNTLSQTPILVSKQFFQWNYKVIWLWIWIMVCWDDLENVEHKQQCNGQIGFRGCTTLIGNFGCK